MKTMDQMEKEWQRKNAETEKRRKIFLANSSKILHDRNVRLLIWEILSYAQVFAVNSSCDSTAHFSEGRRSVGADIIALLEEIDPKLLPTMMIETLEEKK